MDNNNKKSRLTVILVAVCITIGGNVAASEQIYTESAIPPKRVSAQTQMHNVQVVLPIAARQEELAPNTSAGPFVLTPDHITHPATMVALADSLPQPAVAASVVKLEDRTTNTQGQSDDNRADSVGFSYAIAVVLVAFLGMVSVIRRDTRKSK